ncbi:MAG: 5-carboxymethyl-2-hydroxymuconate Delta-isomerase [Steroidobacteraceae bacterium]
MPHIIIEYSANVAARVDLAQFVKAVHAAALETGVFPIGGVRTRAHATEFYEIADGHPDNTFVHVLLRVGQGRDVPTRKRACEQMLAAVCALLDEPFAGAPLAISLEMLEIDAQFAYRKNNLHEYVVRRRGGAAAP